MAFDLVFSDNFNRANTSVGTGANSTTGVGNGWIDRAGNIWKIDSNKAYSESSGFSANDDVAPRALYRPPAEDFESGRIKIKFSGSTQKQGFVARLNDAADTFISASYHGDLIFVKSVVDGVEVGYNAAGIGAAVLPEACLISMTVLTIDGGTEIQFHWYDDADPDTIIYTSGVIRVESAGLLTQGAWGIAAYDHDITTDDVSIYQLSSVLETGTASTGEVRKHFGNVNASAPLGGVAPYSYQWHRSTTSGFTPSGGTAIAGGTTRAFQDTGLLPGTTYYYKLVVTDDAAATATSNEVSITTLAAGTLIVSFLGDSITYGTGAVSPGIPAVNVCCEAMTTAGYITSPLNCGRPATSASGDWLDGAPNLEDHEAADYIQIALGTNNALNLQGVETFSAGLTDLIQACLDTYPDVHYIIVQTVAWASSSGSWGGAPAQALRVEYNDAIPDIVASFAGTGKVILGSTDIHDYFEAHPEELYDGIHPSNDGHVSLGTFWADAWIAFLNTLANITSVTIDQGNVTLYGGQTQTFTATVEVDGEGGTGVEWSLVGPGEIDSETGEYTAPGGLASGAQYASVTATSIVNVTKSDTITVTIPAHAAGGGGSRRSGGLGLGI